VRGKKPRRRSRLPGTVPRPFEKWLDALIREDIWKDDPALQVEWLDVLRQLAHEYECRLIVDSARHWRESVYVWDYRKKGPTILAGAARNRKYGCTAILHELGHHILKSGKRHPRDEIEGENAAWEIACLLAREHSLPFVPHIKRQALYSYRLGALLSETTGSRRTARRRPLPKSWQLEDSARSALISRGFGFYSMGKKGRRHAKRFIKRATAKAERRKPIPTE
jgi:hypothetical protein